MDLLPPLDSPCPNGRHPARVVAFRHPAYTEFERELLRFNAVDGPAKDGLDYEFALICCGIVTGNTWASGWIATVENGQYSRVDRSAGLLTGSTYYYFVGDHAPTHKYPIVPSFHHWRFPHGALPNVWARLEIPLGPESQSTRRDEAVLARDATCRISARKGAREVAHLVPVTEGHWFLHNGMRRYCRDQLTSASINDTMNILVLRKDLHFLFDHRRFVFTAKSDRSSAVHLVVHVLNHDRADEIIDLYHNRRTQVLRGVSTELIFAHLAWALFTSAQFPAFDGTSKVAVQLFNAETSQIQALDLDQHDICGRMRLFKPYSRSQSRSGSPTKRRLDEINEPADADDFWGDELGDCYPDAIDSAPPRGRSRKRKKRNHDTYSQESPPGLIRSASPGVAASSPHSAHTSENVANSSEESLQAANTKQVEVGDAIAATCINLDKFIE